MDYLIIALRTLFIWIVPLIFLIVLIWFERKGSSFIQDRTGPNRAAIGGVRLAGVVHLIADVHQPLHVGRYEDRGGNKIAVRIDGRKANLHKFWDAQWLLKLDRSSHATDTAGQAASIDALGAERIGALQSSDVLDWARESKALRPQVYAFGALMSGEPVTLDAQYNAAALEISRERLAAAGIRLAGTLNDIFCDGAKQSQ